MKAITEKEDHEAIIKYFIDEFNEMLIELATIYEHFHHIDLRKKFPHDSQWDNEIHLKNTGFKEVAEIYHTKIVEILNQDPIKKYKQHLIV
jgi:hypothetical protein